jgi:hypothetical protein
MQNESAGHTTVFAFLGTLVAFIAVFAVIVAGVQHWPIVAAAAAWVAMIMLGVYVAIEKNRPWGEGLILGALFGPLGVIVIALLPTLAIEAEKPAKPLSADQFADRADDRGAEAFIRGQR